MTDCAENGCRGCQPLHKHKHSPDSSRTAPCGGHFMRIALLHRQSERPSELRLTQQNMAPQRVMQHPRQPFLGGLTVPTAPRLAAGDAITAKTARPRAYTAPCGSHHAHCPPAPTERATERARTEAASPATLSERTDCVENGCRECPPLHKNKQLPKASSYRRRKPLCPPRTKVPTHTEAEVVSTERREIKQ